MAEYDDTDRRDDDRYDDGRGDDRLRRARDRVSTPGTLLLGFGALSLLLAVGSLALYAAAPDSVARPYHNFMKDLTKGAPKQPGQPDPVPPYEEFKQQMVVQGMIGSAVSAVCSLIITLGGMRMRSLSGYGLAMAGAILALIPCTNSCCFIGLPVGLWAVVVLANADVKAAFAAARRPTAGME
jgi:hypothetical protein